MSNSPFLNTIRDYMQVRHYSKRTIHSYLYWIKAFTREGQALGLGQAELARQVRQAFFGAEIQRLQRNRHEVRVYVRFPKEQRETLETLRSMWVQLPSGEKVPFDVVGEIVETTGVSTINRIDRHRVVNVQADVDKSKISPAEVVAAIERDVLPEIFERHPAVGYRLSGEAEEQAENVNSLMIGAAVMLILVYAALAIPLRSYGQPLIIMSVIPFGIIGAFIGHLLFGKPLSVFSTVGMVALSGVVVNDSLVLVDYINHRCREGYRLARGGDGGWSAAFSRCDSDLGNDLYGLIADSAGDLYSVGVS